MTTDTSDVSKNGPCVVLKNPQQCQPKRKTNALHPPYTRGGRACSESIIACWRITVWPFFIGLYMSDWNLSSTALLTSSETVHTHRPLRKVLRYPFITLSSVKPGEIMRKLP